MSEQELRNKVEELTQHVRNFVALEEYDGALDFALDLPHYIQQLIKTQTVKALKPEVDFTGFKEIPEDQYEVGDEIFVYGQYGNVVEKDGDVITYQTENSSGKFDTKGRDRHRIMLIQKAKPSVTTRAQKVVVNTIPGYERMMGEVEGILEKTMNRTGSYNQATANAIGYIQKSAVYESI